MSINRILQDLRAARGAIDRVRRDIAYLSELGQLDGASGDLALAANGLQSGLDELGGRFREIRDLRVEALRRELERAGLRGKV